MTTKPADGVERREAPPTPPPWYSSHILKCPSAAQVYDRLITVKNVGGHVIPQRVTQRRSVVAGQSKKARNRMLKLLAMIARTDPCAFVTLTSKRLQDDWEESKREFHNFRCSLLHLFPAVCGVWRFAWQQRGAAHYHLLLWGLPSGDDGTGPSEAALSRIWLKATGESGIRAAVEHACDSKLVGDFRGCGFYVALYQGGQSSTEHDEKQSGRTWGIIGRSRLELRSKYSYTLTDYQSQYVRRVLRKHRQRRQALSRGKKSGKGMGPLARASGSFSAFLPVETSTRLFAYVVADVDGKHRAIAVEPAAQLTA